MEPTVEQLEMLLARCVGTLEGIYATIALPRAVQEKTLKLLLDVYKHTKLKPPGESNEPVA